MNERDAHADHPLSVARTFALAFEQLKKNSPMAADLLTVCAFLAPDAIPETFFIEGASHLGPTFETFAADPLEFNRAIKALLTYSLIQRNAETKMITIHRLVQVVLKEEMDKNTQCRWAEKVVRAVNHCFPDAHESITWFRCQRYFPHAFVCIELINNWKMTYVEAGSLLNHMGAHIYWIMNSLLKQRTIL